MFDSPEADEDPSLNKPVWRDAMGNLVPDSGDSDEDGVIRGPRRGSDQNASTRTRFDEIDMEEDPDKRAKARKELLKQQIMANRAKALHRLSFIFGCFFFFCFFFLVNCYVFTWFFSHLVAFLILIIKIFCIVFKIVLTNLILCVLIS